MTPMRHLLALLSSNAPPARHAAAAPPIDPAEALFAKLTQLRLDPLGAPTSSDALGEAIVEAVTFIASSRRPRPKSLAEGVAEMGTRLLQNPALIEAALTRELARPLGEVSVELAPSSRAPITVRDCPRRGGASP